jgi:DNA-binding transcriptional MerR regulator
LRVSELVAATGVPLATVKFYLREGLLMPGRSTSATRAEYDEQHVRRLALIRALAGLGLPIPKVKIVVNLIDEPTDSLFESLGGALAALPPYDLEVREDYPRARAALQALGQVYDPAYAAVAALESALDAAEKVGIPMTDERLHAYGRHIRAIASADLEMMPNTTPQAAIEYAVLGTAIYEPVIAALRRLAHQDLMATTLDSNPDERLHHQ